ncbi:chromatin remodeling complex Adenosinetriphosphatase [Entomophthora muscae]|uniref:Chromatin remodeling complex Adenosinetriphosphatase n=1 Tax=Entomophthora muscae TaxID=34485 RepID=A0ACC2T8Y7_9FUNG|nr:chromatin remodeling complex Adenosinetriphosphatase [Entomophthora muscae]
MTQVKQEKAKVKLEASYSDDDASLSSLTDTEETAPPPNHQAEEFNLDAEKLKRYSFLLGKSQLFSQFIKFHKIPGLEEKVRDEIKAQKDKSDARHRKTEDEEDKDLIELGEETEKVTVFTESPFYIKGKMRDYQVHGLNWMVSLYENGLNGILADEMGLGKTLQVISFLGFLRHYRSTPGPNLVLVPKTTLHNWLSEFKQWTPEVNAFIFHGQKADRPKLVEQRLKPVDFDVCNTSYEMVLLEKTHFSKIPWEYIVIDEAHRIKNESSLLSKIIRILPSKRRLLVTGTPLQNNLKELWALLNFLLPDVFGESKQFEDWFETQSDGDSVVNQLHQILQPFLLRRIKLDVEKSLLPKKEINLYVGMSEMQRKWYQKLLEKDIQAVNGAVGKKEGATRLLNIVMQLRKCCNHPYLFDGAEPGPPYTTDEHLVDNCGKMAVLDKLLKHLQSKGSRVLIFSQMSRMLDILEDYCVFRDYGFCRIDGNTSHEERIEAIDDYNRPNSDKFVFLLTTRAGGLGINLVTADVVIIYDSDWNPQVDLQAQDRAHRIGQSKQVYVFRMITENAVEEKVIEKANRKLRLDQLVIQQGRAAPQSKANSKEELLDMIQHGAHKVLEGTGSTTFDADIEAVIQRGEQKTKELSEKFQKIGFEDLQNFTTKEGETYLWEGEDYSNKRKGISTLGQKWIQPAKRERKANYDVDNYYRETLRVSAKPSAPKTPRPPRQAQIYDFQFFPKGLFALYEREVLSYQRSINYRIPEPQDGEKETEEKAAKRAEDQAKIDSAEPLTEDEVAMKEAYLAKGFSNWARKDFRAFIAAMEKNGRNNLEAITAEIEGKTLEEVKSYHAVFWEKYTSLNDHEKILESLEKGEERLRRQSEIQELIRAKVRKYSAPLVQAKIHYLTKGKFYTEDEDRFLLVMMDKHGQGSEEAHDKIRDEIRKTPLFRFNWFFKSRTPIEIGRRCATLINCLIKEKGDSSLLDVNGKGESKTSKRGGRKE